jgi:transcriptional regulator of acetoin/glycerol metabolism
MEKLMDYDWPGNIRELVNVLEAAMNFCRSEYIGIKDLPNFLILDHSDYELEEDLSITVEKIKKSEIVAALEKSAGKRKTAAAILGVSKSTLYRLMKKYDLVELEG